jgi:hypothetical protein
LPTAPIHRILLPARRLRTRIAMTARRIAVSLVLGLSACSGTPAATPTDSASVADTTTTADSGLDGGTDAKSGPDGCSADVCPPQDVKQDTGPVACAARAGGYAVDGTCSGGGASIPYACMLAQGCQMTWEVDFRDWTGPLTGNDYALKNASGSETITGSFDTPTTGNYHYASATLTCDASLERIEPSHASRLCCSPLGQDCDKGQACVPVLETLDSGDVLTTGCLDLAKDVTGLGGACTLQQDESQCQVGLVCLSGAGQTTASCRKLCAKAGDCGGSETCAGLTGAPRTGFCSASCTPFADGTGCAKTDACTITRVVDDKGAAVLGTICIVPGGAVAGGTCKAGVDCGAGLACISGKCRPMCDAQHACASGKCTDLGIALGKTLGAGFGTCE